MIESILKNVRRMVIGSDIEICFDTELIIHINTAFSILNSLGIGTKEPFKINDDTAEWKDFTQDNETIEMVKSYVYFKVRLMFDPPTNSFLVDSINNQIKELEWRMQSNCETAVTESSESDNDSQDTD